MKPTPFFHIRRILAGLALGTFAAGSQAAPVYADSATTVNTTSFGSGLLTGAPDSGGAFLSNTFDPPTLLGSITAGFSGGISDGAGADLVIYDCCGTGVPADNELADVFISTDGVAFTLLGAYGAGVNSFDFSGIFASTVYFVQIVNTSTLNSPDIDAFQGNYAGVGTVSAPGTLALAGLALLMMGGLRRRR